MATGPLPGPGTTVPGGRTLVMGILNVTPDSFSDGGRFTDPGAALDHALAMVEDGADMVDVGGESTRPGSARITPEEEWVRIGTVVGALADAGILVSVDTMHASTAWRAAEAGAALVNDVTGGMWDVAMNSTVASTDCAYVIQRYHGLPGSAQERLDHGPDVVATVVERLSEQVSAALAAGVDMNRIIVDPGLGFSLTNEQSWEVVRGIDRLRALGYPVLIGASRKRFLQKESLEERDMATAEVTSMVARAGAWAVRVHNVAANVRVVREIAGEWGRGTAVHATQGRRTDE